MALPFLLLLASSPLYAQSLGEFEGLLWEAEGTPAVYHLRTGQEEYEVVRLPELIRSNLPTKVKIQASQTDAGLRFEKLISASQPVGTWAMIRRKSGELVVLTHPRLLKITGPLAPALEELSWADDEDEQIGDRDKHVVHLAGLLLEGRDEFFLTSIKARNRVQRAKRSGRYPLFPLLPSNVIDRENPRRVGWDTRVLLTKATRGGVSLLYDGLEYFSSHPVADWSPVRSKRDHHWNEHIEHADRLLEESAAQGGGKSAASVIGGIGK